MGLAKHRRRARSRDSESGSEDDFELAEKVQRGDLSGDVGYGNFSTDSDDDDDGGVSEEVSDDEGEEQGNSKEEESRAMENDEMEQLEKEYMDLRNQEQDVVKNLKQHKDEDLQKGEAVKNQKALWNKTLELRFLIQKAFSNSNRLPQEPVRSSFCNYDKGVKDAYQDVITSTKETLDSILELQEALLEKNPSIGQAAGGNSLQSNKKRPEEYKNNYSESDEEWLQISQKHKRIASFRNNSVDKWQRKTQVTTGAAAMKNKLHAFNQSVSEQVSNYMRDPSRMLKQMKQRRSTIGVFGAAPDDVENTKGEGGTMDGDPELLDDTEFYQQLLKEFLETVDIDSSEAAFYALKRSQTKKRKIVDRRASKSRKIRYNVHEKIVNFMAPQPMNLPPMASTLFENLFGLKTQKHAPVA